MDEEKKKFRVAGMVILWVFLLASLGLNGYLLIKETPKEDIFTHCTRCGGGIYIIHDEDKGNYADICDDCIRQSVYDNLNQNSNSNFSNVSEENYAYVTRTGSKYHRIWCRYVSGKNDLSYYESSYEAESAGYDACSVCW